MNENLNLVEILKENPIGVKVGKLKILREIKRLVEHIRTLGSGVLNQPNKESTALDLLRFLEGYPQVKKDIERYACYALEQQLKENEK